MSPSPPAPCLPVTLLNSAHANQSASTVAGCHCVKTCQCSSAGKDRAKYNSEAPVTCSSPCLCLACKLLCCMPSATMIPSVSCQIPQISFVAGASEGNACNPPSPSNIYCQHIQQPLELRKAYNSQGEPYKTCCMLLFGTHTNCVHCSCKTSCSIHVFLCCPI